MIVTADDGTGRTAQAASAGIRIGNSPPANTTLPLISGTPRVGNMLSTTTGNWSDPEGDMLTYSYQWRADGADIAGATGSTFLLSGVQSHKVISVAVAANDGFGGIANSIAAGVLMTNTAPLNTAVPVISGVAQVGGLLSATTGNWDDADNDVLSFGYQWQADSVNIVGATGPTFTLSASEANKGITVTVTASDSYGGQTAATSNVTNLNPGAPVITITTPAANDFVNSLIAISGTATDDVAVVSVEVEVTGSSGTALIAGPALSNTFGPDRIPAMVLGDLWEVNTSLLNWPADTYTIRAFAADGSGNETELTRDFTFFLGSPAYTQLSITTSTPSILNGESIDVSGKLTRLPDDDAIDLTGLPIELKVIAPGGAETVFQTRTSSRFGHFGFLQSEGNGIDVFNNKGNYLLTANFAGNAALSAQQSDPETLLVGTSAGYTVIVQGKVSNEEGLASHNKTTNRIYNTLLKRGFDPSNILYFNYDTSQTGVDGEPSKASVRDAIENQLAALSSGVPAPIYIFMVDHGSPDTFHIGSNTIQAGEVDDWMTTMEANLSNDMKQENRFLIYGACYSGSFIPTVSKPGRVIVASAAANEESYKGALEGGVRVGEYFIEEFMKLLGRGDSFEVAFNMATGLTETYTRRSYLKSKLNRFFDAAAQHPLLDDNGDGMGSNELDDNSLDGGLAATLYLGVGESQTNALLNPADLLSVTETKFLDAGSNSALLFADAVDDGSVASAWFEVRSPDLALVDQGGSLQLEIDLEKVIMQLNDGRWEGGYDGFVDGGAYEIFYFTENTLSGEISPAKRSVVYKNMAGNQPPFTVSLLSPENGDIVKTVLLFDWTDSTDPDGDSLTYTLEIATDTAFTSGNSGSIVYRVEELESSIASVDDRAALPDLALLYWRIIAIDRFGSRAISEINNFFTDNTNGIPGVIQGLVYSSLDFGRLAGAQIASSVSSAKIAVTEYNGNYVLISDAGANITLEVTSNDGSFAMTSVPGITVRAGESTEVNIGLPVTTGNIDDTPPVSPPANDNNDNRRGSSGNSISIWHLVVMVILLLIATAAKRVKRQQS